MRRDARGHSVKWERQQQNLWLTFMLWQRFRRDLFTHSTAACSSLPFSTCPESTPLSRLDQINLQVCNEHYSVSMLQNLVSWLRGVCVTKAISKDRCVRYLLSYKLWLRGKLLFNTNIFIVDPCTILCYDLKTLLPLCGLRICKRINFHICIT